MRQILITGGAGQVGTELARQSWPADVRILLPSRDELDIGSRASVAGWFGSHRIDAVINSAAYTAVDRAETDEVEAFRINAEGPAHLAAATGEAGIPLVHVSTDYVFDGAKPVPYGEDDPTAPLGVYGASKLAGEVAVLGGNPRSVILRTAWVLSVHRGNFLKTMLRVAGSQAELRVVDDQIGCPTSAADIASALKVIALRMIDDADAPAGIFHFVNAGEASWCGLAREIFALSAAAGGPSATVRAIGTADYPTPARRPANSRLATDRIEALYDIRARPWRVAVREIVEELVG